MEIGGEENTKGMHTNTYIMHSLFHKEPKSRPVALGVERVLCLSTRARDNNLKEVFPFLH